MQVQRPGIGPGHQATLQRLQLTAAAFQNPFSAPNQYMPGFAPGGVGGQFMGRPGVQSQQPAPSTQPAVAGLAGTGWPARHAGCVGLASGALTVHRQDMAWHDA